MSEGINLLLDKNKNALKNREIIKVIRIASIVLLSLVTVSSVLVFLLKLQSPLTDLQNEERDVLSKISMLHPKSARLFLASDRIKNIWARKDEKIICFEINKKFCAYLRRKIRDERLIIINDSAENIKKYLKKFGIPKIDYIVSSLPFSFIPDEKKYIIIEETKNILNNNGKFVLYQNLNRLKRHLCNYFPNISIKFVPLNIPPSFIYVCGK